MASDEELLRAYRSTTWTVRLPDRTIRLRPGQPVTDPGFDLPAGIVTAYNPRSRPTAREVNERGNASLAEELAAAGGRTRPALAGGTGDDAAAWEEPGFLVTGLSRGRTVAIAAHFGQNAVLWIGSDGVPVIVAATAGFAGAAPGDII